jgi:hypothetical protein
MKLLYENKDFREKLIEKGKIRREKFDWGISAEIIYKTLQEVSE